MLCFLAFNCSHPVKTGECFYCGFLWSVHLPSNKVTYRKSIIFEFFYFCGMIIIHAVQKLLNTSGLTPQLYISQPSENQELHTWYAKLVATGYTGKSLVMYVHDPSLLMVIVAGRSVKTTLPAFISRLECLLKRQHFKPEFIVREMSLVKEGYVVSKINSRSLLGHMNEMSLNIELYCRSHGRYDLRNMDAIEDNFFGWLSFDHTLRKYRRVDGYWQQKKAISE